MPPRGSFQILLTEEFVEQMLGDLQELNTREEVGKMGLLPRVKWKATIHCSTLDRYPVAPLKRH